MSGEEAVNSLNVHLCFVRRSSEFRTTGAVQLFTKPHPSRLKNGRETNETFENRYLPVYSSENQERLRKASTVEPDESFNLSELLDKIYDLHVSLDLGYKQKFWFKKY